jgi:hypothetical protein
MQDLLYKASEARDRYSNVMREVGRLEAKLAAV